MNNLVGKISAELIEKDQSISDDLIDKININIKPPEEVTGNDVYIRAMYVVSDEVNSYGGRFPADEHSGLIEFLIDSPVMIGHRKDKLPIARNFHAETIQRNNVNWVKVYFYWLKSAERGEDLKKNIDGGIYKECSISFIFNFPECSVCGEDIRECKHRPFVKYDTPDGNTVEAYFNYRQVHKVLETSLVYRGSVKDTSITNELCFTKPQDIGGISTTSKEQIKSGFPVTYRIWDLDCLDKNKEYLVMPAYESLSVILIKEKSSIKLMNHKNETLDGKTINRFVSELKFPDGDFSLDCRLIGYRGKERQKVTEIIKFIKNVESSVKRLELKIVDLIKDNVTCDMNRTANQRRRTLKDIFGKKSNYLIKAGIITGARLKKSIGNFATRRGVEIITDTSPERYLYTFKKILPLKVSNVEQLPDAYRYSFVLNYQNDEIPIKNNIVSKVPLNINDEAEVEVLEIQQSNNEIELLQPRIIDHSGFGIEYLDLSHLSDLLGAKDKKSTYKVFLDVNKDLILELDHAENRNCFIIEGYSNDLLNIGRRFLTDNLDIGIDLYAPSYESGEIQEYVSTSYALSFKLTGPMYGKFCIRSILLNGINHYLFYSIPERT